MHDRNEHLCTSGVQIAFTKQGEKMSRSALFGTVRILFVVAVVICFSGHANAQTLVETSFETRFQLDLHVPDAALATFLPAGWTANPSTQGASKDANLRCVFIDR